MITKISNVKIIEASDKKGLVALASIVINDSFYLGSIGIYIALKGGYKGYRLTFPTKKLKDDNDIKLFFPINISLTNTMNRAIINEYLFTIKNK